MGELRGLVKEVSIELVCANPWNPNVVSEALKKKLKRSLQDEGFVAPLVVRRKGEEYEVLDGEHRLEAARELGMATVPVVDLGEVDDQRAKLLTLRLSIKGEHETLKLSDLIQGLVEEIEVEDLAEIIPYDPKDIEALADLTQFDWKYKEGGYAPQEEGEEWVKMVVGEITGDIPRSLYEVFEQAWEKARGLTGSDKAAPNLELITANFLATPEESMM